MFVVSPNEEDENKNEKINAPSEDVPDLIPSGNKTESIVQIVMRSKRSGSIDRMRERDDVDPISKRIASIMSLNDMDDGTAVKEAPKTYKPIGSWQKMVNCFDLTILKSFVFWNITLGMTLTMHADSTFFTLLPMYLFELDFTKVT